MSFAACRRRQQLAAAAPGSSGRHPPPAHHGPPAFACGTPLPGCWRRCRRSERRGIGWSPPPGHIATHRLTSRLGGAWHCTGPTRRNRPAVGHGGLELLQAVGAAPDQAVAAEQAPGRCRGQVPLAEVDPSASTARARSIRSLTMNRGPMAAQELGAGRGASTGAVGSSACLARYCTSRPPPQGCGHRGLRSCRTGASADRLIRYSCFAASWRRRCFAAAALASRSASKS